MDFSYEDCTEIMEELKSECDKKNQGLKRLKDLDLIVFDNSLRSVKFDKKVSVEKIMNIVILRAGQYLSL